MKTIKSKLILLMTILICGMIFIGFYSVRNLAAVNEKSTIISRSWVPGIVYSEGLNTMTSDFRILEYEHIISNNIDEMKEKEKSMEEKQSEIQKCMDNYEKTIDEKDDEQLFATVKAQWSKYLDLNKKVITLSKELKTEEAMKIMRNDSKVAFDLASSSLLKLVEYNKNMTEKASMEGHEQYTFTMKVTVFVIISSVIIGAFLTIFVIRSIRRPIHILKTEIMSLSEKGGDLTQDIKVNSKDEIGELALILNKFIFNLRGIIISVNESMDKTLSINEVINVKSTELNSKIEDISATTQQISAGMEQTAASAEEMSAASQEIEKAVQSIAERSEQGALSATEISKRAIDMKENFSIAQQKD